MTTSSKIHFFESCIDRRWRRRGSKLQMKMQYQASPKEYLQKNIYEKIGRRDKIQWTKISMIRYPNRFFRSRFKSGFEKGIRFEYGLSSLVFVVSNLVSNWMWYSKIINQQTNSRPEMSNRSWSAPWCQSKSYVVSQ